MDRKPYGFVLYTVGGPSAACARGDEQAREQNYQHLCPHPEVRCGRQCRKENKIRCLIFRWWAREKCFAIMFSMSWSGKPTSTAVLTRKGFPARWQTTGPRRPSGLLPFKPRHWGLTR